MLLTLLPTEIILMIEEELESKRDLNALICSNSRFALLFNKKLYRDNSESEHRGILVWAAHRGLENTMRMCFQNGATVRRRDRYMSHQKHRDEPDELNIIPRSPVQHPLVAAAEAGSLACVKLLLTHRVLPNYLDEHYETPMRQAAGNGHLEVVEFLLCSTYDALAGNFKLRRPLKYAAARGQIRTIRAIFRYLESGDRGLTVKEAAQIIMLEGLWHGHNFIVHFAIEKGADVNDDNPEFALRFASDVRPDEDPYRPRPRLIQPWKRTHEIRGRATRGWMCDVSNALHAALIGGTPGLIELVLGVGFDLVRNGGEALRLAALRRDIKLARDLTRQGVPLVALERILKSQSSSHRIHITNIVQDMRLWDQN